jgi:hypothetical protein
MADVSRRAVVRGGIGVLGIAAVGFGDSAFIGRAAAVPSRSVYASAIGEVFEATADGRTSRLRLTSATAAPTATTGPRSESFTLTFEPVRGDRPDDGIYALRGASVPLHDLFVSSMGPDSTMQAVVNRTV